MSDRNKGPRTAVNALFCRFVTVKLEVTVTDHLIVFHRALGSNLGHKNENASFQLSALPFVNFLSARFF